MRSRRRVPDSQLQKFVQRLLQSTKPDVDVPVIISTMEGAYCSSVGRLLERQGGRVSALVDVALEPECAVTVFLPENAYLGEVLSCAAQGERFAVELVLIQYRTAPD